MVVQWVFTGFSSSYWLFTVLSVHGVLTVFARGACGVRTGLPAFSLVLLAFSLVLVEQFRPQPPSSHPLLKFMNGKTQVV